MFWFLDNGALVGGLCLACIRLGNFMNGEIVGAPTEVAWAIIFPTVDQIPRHPVQLYGFFVYMSLFIFILYYRNRNKKMISDGHIFGVFIALLGSIRFCMEFIKRHYVLSDDSLLNMAQYLSIPMILSGLVLTYYTRAKSKLS